MSKLRFRVVYASSEDTDYPADELNAHGPTTRGWQSAKRCQYPQELIFEMSGGHMQISQVQILSHQCKIASKIEIFIGSGHDFRSTAFKRLGYLSLDSNERSSFQARELKTVYIDNAGKYIRLLVHSNFQNKLNTANQVGLVAVNFTAYDDYGDSSSSVPNYDNPPPAGAAPTSNLIHLSINMSLDPQTTSKLRLLAEAKIRAVAGEDYLTAKQIKQVESELHELGSKLSRLEMAKKDAVRIEDYDRAREIKGECDRLRADVEKMVRGIRIAGVTDVSPIFRADPPARSMPSEFRQADALPDDAGDHGFSSPSARGVGGQGVQASPLVPLPAVRVAAGYDSGYPSARIINVDDIPVGPGVRGAGGGSVIPPEYADDDGLGIDSERALVNTSSLKKRLDVGGVDADAGTSVEDVGEDLRPIRSHQPKSKFQPDSRDDGMPSEYSAAAGGYPHEVGDNFDHPLHGVPNYQNLPSPEEISLKAKEIADPSGLIALLGEYRVRCLFSKQWTLRDAAVNKMEIMLLEELENSPGVSSCALALLTAVKVGLEDKFQQVFLSAISLLENLLDAFSRNRVSRASTSSITDSIINVAIEKLSDANQRIRDGAKKTLDILGAASDSVGPTPVGLQALKAIPAKQKTQWRPLQARLEVLRDITVAYGIGVGHSSLSVDAIMSFMKNNGAFQHSNDRVRDTAKDLTVALYKYANKSTLDNELQALLRPKQLEEYMAAIEGGPSVSAGPKSSAKTDAVTQVKKSSGAPKKQQGKLLQGDGPASARGGKEPGGSGERGEYKSHDRKSSAALEQEGAAEVEDFTCTFCGAGDTSWNEDILDMHYLKTCPLLAPCPACAQVLEIAALPDHLLDECDQKTDYIPCDTTGLAIKATEFESWRQSPKCAPPPDNCFFCPLCIASVEDSNDAWRDHLLRDCPKNTRIRSQ